MKVFVSTRLDSIQLGNARQYVFSSLTLHPFTNIQTHYRKLYIFQFNVKHNWKIVTMKYLHRFCLSVVYCCYLARVCVCIRIWWWICALDFFIVIIALLFRYFQVQWSEICLHLTNGESVFTIVFECLFYETNTFELIACLLFAYRFLVDVLNQFGNKMKSAQTHKHTNTFAYAFHIDTTRWIEKRKSIVCVRVCVLKGCVSLFFFSAFKL